ncbi:hypothetical protein T4B_3464 [Trichinella pseudospiralis]|uniref:Uncharacterized protein n=1 Tax=Trichinella pseudospiralis TaxID=6337 RepID=A0A0V1K3A7_TRIPS|nr:hypothetical protein T4A_1116 [Trichinella pseudospiralis]KRZ21021.1 hypothetical protein T4B_3464 [Trichinella pseudospiralis]KRZ41706.1 hypothetical protein T4C_2821 [Trichinella pseudospiralis]
MIVKGMHGLNARVADLRLMRVQLGPGHDETTDSASMKMELSAHCILSICDALVASMTPWLREIDLPQAAALASPPTRQ